MTPREDQIMSFMRDFMSTHGFSPSVPVIAKTIGLGMTATNRYLNMLEDSGEIRKRGKSIEILIDPPVSTMVRNEKGSAAVGAVVGGEDRFPVIGTNVRLPRATAPQLGALLATFDRMGNRA